MNLTHYPVNYQTKIYRPRDITPKQLKFCEAIIAGETQVKSAIIAGYKSPNKSARNLLKTKRINEYITRRSLKISVPVTYESKVDKLSKIVEHTIPDVINIDTAQQVDFNTGIRAISELNRMQGHYAADKHINVNVDTDVNEAQSLLDRLIAENKQEY